MTSGEVSLKVKDGSLMKFKFKKTKPRSNSFAGMVKKRFTSGKSRPQSAHMSNTPPTSDIQHTYLYRDNPDAKSAYLSPEPSRTLPSLPDADEADVSKASSARGEQVLDGQVKKSSYRDSWERFPPPLPQRFKSTSNQICADTGSRSVADREIGRDSSTYGEEEGDETYDYEDPTPYYDVTPDLSVNPSTQASNTRDSGPSTLLSIEEGASSYASRFAAVSMTGNTDEADDTDDNDIYEYVSTQSLDSEGHENEEDKVPADPRHCPVTEDLGTALHQNDDKTVSQTTEPMTTGEKLPPIRREDPTIKPDQLPQQEQSFICVNAEGWDQLFQQNAAPLKQHLRRVWTDHGAESPICGKEVEGNDNSRRLRLLDLHKDLARNHPIPPPVNDLENTAAACAVLPEEQPLLSFEGSISTASSPDEDYDRTAYLMNFHKILEQNTGNYCTMSTSRPSVGDYLNVKTGEGRDIDEDLNLANDD